MLARVLMTIGAGIAGFILAALVVTVVDLYMSGHGMRPLGDRRLVDVERAGIHLSVADGLTLVVAVFAAGAAAAAAGGPRRN